ncbi:hypothetical protein I7I48_10411 [Histoplasma ohiense]|nr:hypothetical protein I7I48_10411 [Histoplasma ohiense (nom. inval.)]
MKDQFSSFPPFFPCFYIICNLSTSTKSYQPSSSHPSNNEQKKKTKMANKLSFKSAPPSWLET